VVDVAIGILMERYCLGLEDASAMLPELADHDGRDPGEFAAGLVAAHSGAAATGGKQCRELARVGRAMAFMDTAADRGVGLAEVVEVAQVRGADAGRPPRPGCGPPEPRGPGR
jgi:hypothetical protein